MKQQKLHINSWYRDSHGLFDYEKSNIISSSFIPSNGYLYRTDKDILFTQTELVNEPQKQFLAKVRHNPLTNEVAISTNISTHLPINNTTLTDLQEKIWTVVKPSSPNQSKYSSNYEYELKINDIIKLGRIKFIVKEMNIIGNTPSTSSEIFVPFENITNVQSSSTCLICYLSTSTDDNPLMQVCQCKGTMSVHLECLKNYLKMKLTCKEIFGKPIVIYTVQRFNCSVCNEPYPVTIKLQDKKVNLIDYNIPEGQNYIVLQSLNSIKENEYPLSVYMMMFTEDNSSFTLGRGHGRDIRIDDISVSRLHARIKLENGKIYIEDEKSKFGTLVLAKEEVVLRKGVKCQIGRSLVYYGDDYYVEGVGDDGEDSVIEIINDNEEEEEEESEEEQVLFVDEDNDDNDNNDNNNNGE